MWQEDKKKELQERKLVQALYRDLVGMAKQNELNKKVSLCVEEIFSSNIEKLQLWQNQRNIHSSFCILLNEMLLNKV